MKQRALIIKVPEKDGIPDLNLPPGTRIREEIPGHIYQMYWGDHMITMRRIATEGGEPVFAVAASEGAYEDLVARLDGTRVAKLKALWDSPTDKALLTSYGEFKEVEGYVEAPHMWSGGNALAMGSDYEYVPTEKEPE